MTISSLDKSKKKFVTDKRTEAKSFLTEVVKSKEHPRKDYLQLAECCLVCTSLFTLSSIRPSVHHTYTPPAPRPPLVSCLPYSPSSGRRMDGRTDVWNEIHIHVGDMGHQTLRGQFPISHYLHPSTEMGHRVPTTDDH